MKKNLKNFGLFLLLFCFSANGLLANNDYPKVKTLRTEIVSLIEKPDLSVLEGTETDVRLSFLVNEKKEVVVIAADTRSDYLETYLKNKLNYQQIKTDFVQINKIYHIKLLFKKTE
ncbi:MAG: hypothetical protein AAF960_19225 [Bacteroidota bacterium]